ASALTMTEYFKDYGLDTKSKPAPGFHIMMSPLK
ncbi:hypothetical protein LCGC14_2425560, partial [marine sediment metagenome]